MRLLVILICICYFELYDADGISSSIPEHLARCYRKDYLSKLHKPPLNVRLLVELIRSFENQGMDSFNMRLFTTTLMRSVRYDGVIETAGVTETEFSIPYRATGQPFYKYKLLVDYLILGKSQQMSEKFMSRTQFCLLHEIISSRIQTYTHDTNPHMCPRYYQSSNLDEYTECYVESGIVDSKWGLISPGHLVAGVAAALQQKSLDVQDLLMTIRNDSSKSLNYTQYRGSINNIWMATIIGDLGEITLQQAFQPPKIGTPGIWDNKLLPRIYYLRDKYHDMTSAELLGAIDGAIIGYKISDWVSILSNTRFSQIIDMYYSKRGIAYNKLYKACNRQPHLNELMQEGFNLTEHAYKAAKVLREMGASLKTFSPDALLTYASSVVEEFRKQTVIKFAQHSDCNLEMYNTQPLEVFVIFDESWREEKINEFVGLLADAIDLGKYGSSIGLINSNSGSWLTNITDSMVQLYDELGRATNEWQLPLRLSNGLSSIMDYLRKNKWTECKVISKIPRASVLLLLANSAMLSSDDLNVSREILRAIKNDFPETRVVYVTSPINYDSYVRLSQLHGNDVIIKTSETDENIIPKITEFLSKIPNRIMDFSCSNSEIYMEDYLTPEETKIYEIHKEYIKRSDFFVKFKGYDYGQASVCIYDSAFPRNKVCKGIGGTEEISFLSRTYCSNVYNCSVEFLVTMTQSNLKCSEFDCRYPDQMRIEITTRTYRSGSTTICYSIYAVVVVLLGICLNIS